MADNVLKFPIARRAGTPHALLTEYVPMLRRELPAHVTEARKDLKRARKEWLQAVGQYEKLRARAVEPRKRIRRWKGQDVRVINVEFARSELQSAFQSLRFARQMLGEWVELYYSQPWVYGDEAEIWDAMAEDSIGGVDRG